MVYILPFLGAVTLLSSWASALPRPDSSINEPAVSAPNGIPITDTSGVSSQVATATQASAAEMTQPPKMTEGGCSGGSCGGSGSSGCSGGSCGGSSGNSGNSKENSPSWSPPVYGSGKSNWGSGYDDCVSQCMAKFGSPMGSYQPPTSTTGGENSGSKGTGATHTVIVAPTQGVLRYIPFAVNASVGDTIKFMWGANNHTVTKSSALLPCNKTGDALFTSGTQNKDFVFTQVVNDTNPTFFYCGTPTHCQKGMFGVINPSSSFGSPSSFAGMVQNLSATNPDVATYAALTKQGTANNTAAAGWGSNIDLAGLPEWSHSFVAENILFTRNFLASNPETLKDNGVIDLGTSQSTPLMIPQDVAAALNTATPASNAASSPNSAAPAATSATATSTATAASQNNGAGSLTSPRALVGLVVVIATFFAL